jgi:uncharacterized phiE125 gp8 family phage protein
MAGAAQEKRPNETIELTADFSQVLLPVEQILSANVAVTAANLKTDADATGSIIVGGSVSSTTSSVTVRVQSGVDGDAYRILFQTGLTNLSNRYETTLSLIVTNYPLGDNLFTALPDVKRELGITDGSDDLLLNDLLLAATAYLQQRIGRDLFYKAHTERIYCTAESDGRPQTGVFLRHYPVQQVDAVRFYDTAGALATTITDSTQFDITNAGWLFFRGNYAFPDAGGYTEVDYRAGYFQIPLDVQEATKRIVSVLYRSRGREGLMSEKLGDYSWTNMPVSLGETTRRVEVQDHFVEGVISRYRRLDLFAL